jgi:excisionase family DNA binding protein
VPFVDEELLTVAEVAQRLKVHQETVRRWLRVGQLRGIKLSDQAGYRVRPSELERMLQQLEATSAPDTAPPANEKVAARPDHATTSRAPRGP